MSQTKWNDQNVRYVGEMKDGEPCGYGKLYVRVENSVYIDGDNNVKHNYVLIANGEWKNGELHGKGEVYENGTGKLKYLGNWKNGKLNGSGRERCTKSDGDLYIGDYLNGKRTGYGKVYNVVNGNQRQIYNGRLIDGRYDGKGILDYDNGCIRYNGEWKLGQRFGMGKSYHFETGILSYDGEWGYSEPMSFWRADGMRHGMGKSYREDGTLEYDGEWIHGKQCSNGTIFDKDGIPVTGFKKD